MILQFLEFKKNEKYKGDAIFHKYYTPDHLKKSSKRNKGELDSYYIEDDHAAIITREMWNQVQEEIKRRAEAKGNVEGDTDKYKNRYPLTGMLYCSKCGSTLRRRTWNRRYSYKKIVWQCSNYIKNGKDTCTGTSIDDDVISSINVKEETIVKEEFKDGKKCYSYTCKRKQNQLNRANAIPEKKNGSIHMRWGIETSFRELKCAIGLTNFHSKKVDYIIQEIFARLTMYNFCEIITTHVVVQQKNRKYSHQVNYTMAISICMQYFRCSNVVSPPNVEALI